MVMSPEDWQTLGALVGLFLLVLPAVWLLVKNNPFDDGDF
jgi:hypothetical protein